MRQASFFLSLGAIGALAVATAALGARPSPASGPAPAVMQSLLACRVIADSTARLASFDKASASVAGAIETRELVMIDKAKATAAADGGIKLADLPCLISEGASGWQRCGGEPTQVV